MRTTPNFGEQINAWHEEWQASKDLQFKFPIWTAYAFGRRLRAEWDAAPDLQRQYGDDFRAFSTATKNTRAMQPSRPVTRAVARPPRKRSTFVRSWVCCAM